jgi:hypothetical protein
MRKNEGGEGTGNNGADWNPSAGFVKKKFPITSRTIIACHALTAVVLV